MFILPLPYPPNLSGASMSLINMINDPVVTAKLTITIDEWSPEYRSLEAPYKCYRHLVGTIITQTELEIVPLTKRLFTAMLNFLDLDKAVLLILAMHHGPEAVADLLDVFRNKYWVSTLYYYDDPLFTGITRLQRLDRLKGIK